MGRKTLFRRLALCAAAVLLAAGAAGAAGAESAGAYTDVAVLTTTDMHGKCWNVNLLTDGAENSNMLRVSTAVKEVRAEFGAENVLLIDNGDLFQGTVVSQVQLADYSAGRSREPLVMALCLKEIGYDAFVPGNHEFNFAWATMSDAYRWLEENHVPVVAANIVHDGTDGVHAAGENVFAPYVIRTVTVGGHPHKIGILGLENTDVPRWDLPVHYPGLAFAHPGNENCSLSAEAGLYIPRMKEEGCEFIIVSCHGGLGSADGELVFGHNTEDQGLRLIRETEDVDLLILGHDHSSVYSGGRYENRAGRPVPVVNGGSRDLTRTVIRFTEDESGALAWEFRESGNLDLGNYEPDPELEAEVAPYAERAAAEVNVPLGTLAGDWDGNRDFYLRQTDTMDLVSAATMEGAGRRLAAKYPGGPESVGVEGLDHLTVDLSFTSVVVNSDYTAAAGGFSMRDVYRLYRFENNVLVLPLRGREIRAVMEENASRRLAVRVLKGEPRFFIKGDRFTNLLIAGINFTYDMSRPEGERVQIEGFPDGRPFDDDAVYLVTVNNYILGNDGCGLRAYGTEDAIWYQREENPDETIQDMIAEYVRIYGSAEGGLTPDVITWHWSVAYTADPAAEAPDRGSAGAVLSPVPEEGHAYVLYQESEGFAVGGREVSGGLDAAECAAAGETLVSPLPEDVPAFTVHYAEGGSLLLTDPMGRYLTCGTDSSLVLREEPDENGRSLWTPEEAGGGWHLLSSGGNAEANPPALDYRSGVFTVRRPDGTESNFFNFYEPVP